MRRAWNQVRGPEGSGPRFATALGCLATEEYVRSVLAAKDLLDAGAEVTFVALRAKFDPSTGERLEDYQRPGDYVTVGYRFDTRGEGWELGREPNFEGEQSADDYAAALALRSDRDFCEAMVQLKCILDRVGGQVLIRPYTHEDAVVGYAYHYEHIVKDQPREPDQKEPEVERPAETPEEMHAEIEAEKDPVEA